MGFYTDNAPHWGRSLDLWSPRPLPRQMPMVTVFPAVSNGARTPGAHVFETRVVENFRARYERPVQIKALRFYFCRVCRVGRVWLLPLNRPLEIPGLCGLFGRSQR